MRQGWRIGLLVAAMGLGAGALAQGGGYQGQQQQQPMGGSAGGQQQGEQPMGGAGQTQAGRGAMGGSQLAADTKENVLAQLHQINQSEIELGRLASEKAQSPQVKQLGQKLMQDHQSADQKLTQFAQQQGLKIPGQFTGTNEVQKNLQQLDKSTRSVLQSIEGRGFDQQYLASEVADHDVAITTATQALQRYPELAPVVNELLPALRQHRTQAYQLLGEVTPRAQARPAPTGR